MLPRSAVNKIDNNTEIGYTYVRAPGRTLKGLKFTLRWGWLDPLPAVPKGPARYCRPRDGIVGRSREPL